MSENDTTERLVKEIIDENEMTSKVLLHVLTNILRTPKVEKFRKVNKKKELYQKHLKSLVCQKLLFHIGFKENDEYLEFDFPKMKDNFDKLLFTQDSLISQREKRELTSQLETIYTAPRDKLYRKGIDDPKKRIWVLPMKKDESKSTNCRKCGSGMACIHDVCICWKCKESFCLKCLSPNGDINVLMRQDSLIQNCSKCPSCTAELGAVTLPTVFICTMIGTQLTGGAIKGWKAGVPVILKEVEYCVKSAMSNDEQSKSVEFYTRALNCLNFVKECFPLEFTTEVKIFWMKIHFWRAMLEENMYLTLYVRHHIDSMGETQKNKATEIVKFQDLFLVKSDLNNDSMVAVQDNTIVDEANLGPQGQYFPYPQNAPEFHEFHGVRRGFRYWMTRRPAITQIFDFRWTFPTADDAKKFYAKRLDVLSEENSNPASIPTTVSDEFKVGEIFKVFELRVENPFENNRERGAPNEDRSVMVSAIFVFLYDCCVVKIFYSVFFEQDAKRNEVFDTAGRLVKLTEEKIRKFYKQDDK